MSKYVIYSKTNGQVLNITDQYTTEEDGTVRCIVDNTATVGYHISLKPTILEMTEAQLTEAGINMNNINDYLVQDDKIVKNPNPDTDDSSGEYVPGTDLEADKEYMIAKSKAMLAEWLENNPMQFTDGKYYSVTFDKQSLLNGNLASYERAKNAGIEYPLKWNSTGDACSPWTYENLLTLSLTIAAYVAPKVSQQQEIELAIKACETSEDVLAIEINYNK